MKIKKVLWVPVAVMVIGYLLLVLINLIPYQWIQKEVEDSAGILIEEGTYPSGFLDGWFLDNWTDADCISITMNKNSNNPFFNALNAFQLKGDNDSNSGTDRLLATLEGNASTVVDHSYLWNGFQIWLKILLIRYNITEIRTLLFLVTVTLITAVCILLVKQQNNLLGFIPFLASVSFFNFQMESLSLLFFTDIFVMLLGTIAVLVLSGKEKQELLSGVFAAIGASVAFFSMLIMPLLTLAFPLIIVFITNEKCNGKLQCFLRYILSWLYGYGVTMVIKILISFAIVNKGTGFGQVAGYTGLGTHSFKGRIWMIFVTFLNVINRSRIESDLAYAITVCLIIYIAVKKRTNLQMIKSLWPLLVVALFPCAWCFVCAVHAGHGWTLWNYSISIFAFLEILWQMCGFKVALFSEVT